jgi:hypothetical protein
MIRSLIWLCLLWGVHVAGPDIGLASSVEDRAQGARHVVQQVVEAAAKNARRSHPVRGDALAELYIRQAAHAALQLDEDIAPRAFLIGVGIALDHSTALRTNPITRNFVKRVESDGERVRRLRVLGQPTMRSRRDLLLHFATSASLTSQMGREVAEAAGFAKEMMDAQGGSGFSFADVTANQAGIYFASHVLSGELTLGELASSFDAGDFMPTVDGLPEGLDSEEFEQLYGGGSSDKYQQQISEIRTRVRQLPGLQ